MTRLLLSIILYFLMWDVVISQSIQIVPNVPGLYGVSIEDEIKDVIIKDSVERIVLSGSVVEITYLTKEYHTSYRIFIDSLQDSIVLFLNFLPFKFAQIEQFKSGTLSGSYSKNYSDTLIFNEHCLGLERFPDSIQVNSDRGQIRFMKHVESEVSVANGNGSRNGERRAIWV